MQAEILDPTGLIAVDGVLSDSFCEQAIAMHGSSAGVVASADASGGMAQRKGKTLHLIEKQHEAFAKAFYSQLQPAIRLFGEHIKPFGAFHRNYSAQNLLYFSAPRIERIDVGEGFGWHIDADPYNPERCLAVVAYMNDVAEGGETEFAHQNVKVAARRGRVALFPPYWSHLHQGSKPVSGPKFTIAAFMCMRLQPRAERLPAPGGARPGMAAQDNPSAILNRLLNR
jgi:hypothetical protein